MASCAPVFCWGSEMSGVLFASTLESPVGDLLLLADELGLRALYMEYRRYPPIAADWRRDEARFTRAKQQLRAYFGRELRDFDLPLSVVGSPFQKRVWDELLRIPYGQTVSYGSLARTLGDAKASRAVGLANGRNPISIIVPCHRVVGSTGSLTGYGGGIERKRWLLAHESGEAQLF